MKSREFAIHVLVDGETHSVCKRIEETDLPSFNISSGLKKR